MNMQVAVLCDAATDDNMKLSLLGAFDTIYAPQMPAIHQHCAVALRMTFASGDEGTRRLSINFINADGLPITNGLQDIPMPVALPEDVHFVTRNFIVHFQGLEFKEPGLYSVDIRLDGQPCASIPLLVRLMETSRTPNPNP